MMRHDDFAPPNSLALQGISIDGSVQERDRSARHSLPALAGNGFGRLTLVPPYVPVHI